MIDVLDIFAFLVFAVLLAAVVVIVVTLGSLPGQIAQKRGHPQAAAVTVAGWLGVATMAQGDIALGLIQVYRALGGGWELRLAEPAAPVEGIPAAPPAAEVLPQPQAPAQPTSHRVVSVEGVP